MHVQRKTRLSEVSEGNSSLHKLQYRQVALQLVRCFRCQGTQGMCPECRGARSIACQVCRGSVLVPCTMCGGVATIKCYSCRGIGRKAKCSRCSGTQRTICSNCKGKGKLEGEWSRSLNQFSVEKLRFEREKRQAQIREIEGRLNHLEQSLQYTEARWAEKSHRYQQYHTEYDSYGYKNSTQDLQSQIMGGEGHIGELRREIQAIEGVIDSKMK